MLRVLEQENICHFKRLLLQFILLSYSDFIKQGINTGLSVYWEETPLSKHLK